MGNQRPIRSKGGQKAAYSTPGRNPMGKGVRNVPPNLSKAVAAKMIGMRLSGKSQAECDAWLESVIQEIEKIERESNNGQY